MDDTLAAEVEAAERGVWAALMRGDKPADLAALTPDFLGVYPSGFASRAEHAAQLDMGPSISAFTLSQITVRRLAEGVALIAYRARYTRSGCPEAAMYVTSIWRRGPDGWQSPFSQDTPAD